MNFRQIIDRTLALTSLGVFASGLSFSAVILDTGFIALKANDPNQAGRISRNGIPSDWSGLKAFPGIVNASVLYHYETFTLPVTVFPYIQISIDDPGAAVLGSAYLNAFTPSAALPNNGLAVNYLGDAGSSGNPAGNPGFFQVVLPNVAANQLVLDIDGVTGGAYGDPFRVIVEGFYDSEYNDTTPPTPEPATVGLSASGLVGALAFSAWRKRKKA